MGTYYQLESYQVSLEGKTTNGLRAVVYCKDAVHNIRCILYFWEDDMQLSGARETDMPAGVQRFEIHYHMKEFDSVIDILRNEDPVGVYYQSPTVAHIFTGTEPVGEGEFQP